MICRNYRDGQKLDVSGLNEITVLLDRSESGLTEIGYNKWSPNQDGPPHKHPDKDQVFYIHDGVGDVVLGGKKHSVKPGDLVYVPSGLLHQTITTTPRPLCYVLFNVFNDASKEGHLTFADHIEKVKLIRRAQADSGRSDADGISADPVKNEPVVLQQIFKPGENGVTTETPGVLLDWNMTNRFEFRIEWLEADLSRVLPAHNNVEMAFFVLDGKLQAESDDTNIEIREGDLFFIPAGIACKLQAGDKGSFLLQISSSLR
ncbi:MAG: cupin domain-containing protein [Cyclonatronaceae bacterium]